jgi:hypothetical protein
MESSFDHDFGNVRVHANNVAAESARSLDARAYTVGSHLVFDSGQYDTTTSNGQRLLAHELAHVVQQRSRVPTLQGRLNLGEVSDRSESEADQAARLVMQDRPVPRLAAQPVALRRNTKEPTCHAKQVGKQKNLFDVTCGSEQYQAQVVWLDRKVRKTVLDAYPGYNDTEINLTISICRGGTEVQIRPSVDLPRALRDMLVNQLYGGQVLEGVTLKPRLQVTIIQSKTYQITISGGPTVDPRTGKVRGGEAGVSVGTKHGKYGVSVEHERGQQGRPSTTWVKVVIRPGSHAPPKVDCTKKEMKAVLRCKRLTITPGMPARPAIKKELTRRVFIMYKYNRTVPIAVKVENDDGSISTYSLLKGPEKKSAIVKINELVAQGFRVKSIAGHASPEGPRPPSRRRRFMGNIALARKRGAKAKKWLEEAFPDSGAAGVTPAVDAKKAELFSPGRTPELEGRDLVRWAVPRFLESTDPPDPLRPPTAQAREAITRLPLAKQRQKVYKLLRRADVVLTRTKVVEKAREAVKEKRQYKTLACPRSVSDAVRKALNIKPGWMPVK